MPTTRLFCHKLGRRDRHRGVAQFEIVRRGLTLSNRQPETLCAGAPENSSHASARPSKKAHTCDSFRFEQARRTGGSLVRAPAKEDDFPVSWKLPGTSHKSGRRDPNGSRMPAGSSASPLRGSIVKTFPAMSCCSSSVGVFGKSPTASGTGAAAGTFGRSKL